tara:strand:+ start:1287 stop:1865 length:579 start_codon:yes stop_codon:yes gene_type:complete
MIYTANKKYIDFASDLINSGCIIIYPTDTLYGFGVDATNTNSIFQLNKLKGRCLPLSIILDSIDRIEDYAILNEETKFILEKIFPGPYTALLKAKNNNLSKLVQNGSSLIGIRIPNHYFPITIVKKINKPIITTSINKHGKETLDKIPNIKNNFPNIDIFEDPKYLKSSGSTIINFSKSPNEIVRQGDGLFP